MSQRLRSVIGDFRHSACRDSLVEGIADGERAQAILGWCHRLSVAFYRPIKLLDLQAKALRRRKAPRDAAALVDQRERRGGIWPGARQIHIRVLDDDRALGPVNLERAPSEGRDVACCGITDRASR